MSVYDFTREELIQKFEEAGSYGVSLYVVSDELGIEDINEFLKDNYFLFTAYRKAQASRVTSINKTLIEKANAGDLKAINALREHTNLYNFIEQEDIEFFRPKDAQKINEIYEQTMQKLRQESEI
jgi:hypothetical protein